ncbi:MAG TPA: hypothetical protein VGB98_26315 [Pyrinomonadaceae bacterium]|jgi:hypothetical protein
MAADKEPDAVAKAAGKAVEEWLNVSDDIRNDVAADNIEFVVAMIGLMAIVNPEAYERYSKLLETPAK